jgi:hypothetical protein
MHACRHDRTPHPHRLRPATAGRPRVSHQEFAAHIGVANTHFSAVLTGSKTLTYEMGVRIARGLGVRHGAVFYPADPPGPVRPIAARPRKSDSRKGDDKAAVA